MQRVPDNKRDSHLSNSSMRMRLRTIGLYAAGGLSMWLLLTIVFSLSGYIDDTRLGRDNPFSRHFSDTAYGFAIWGMLSPFLFAFASSTRFLEATLAQKLFYSACAAITAFVVMMAYVFNVTAPHWGYEPLDFLKVQRIVDWLGDAFLFLIVMMLGYIAAVVRQSQHAALDAARLKASLLHEQAQRNSYEATYLRGRLGSHFVMNALSNVLGLMRLGDTQRAEDATILLSDILRGMTGEDTANLVTLSTEIDLAEKYLAFQRIRYPDLTSSFNIEPAALTAQVPSQLLQPLLENVFKHARLPKEAVLKVAAQKQADTLILTVANNSTATEANTTSDGEGMTLTRLRLKTLMEGYGAITR